MRIAVPSELRRPAANALIAGPTVGRGRGEHAGPASRMWRHAMAALMSDPLV
jgi:hypothetical protein